MSQEGKKPREEKKKKLEGRKAVRLLERERESSLDEGFVSLDTGFVFGSFQVVCLGFEGDYVVEIVG